MSSPRWWLPSEMWLQVFGFLGPGDRLRVRAVCKEFRELVDSSALWRDWTVRLRRDVGVYNEQFWNMLRCWRVTSAALSSPQHWTDLSTELSQLTTLILDYDCSDDLKRLQCFTRLQRLHLKQQCKLLSFGKLLPLLPPQLTHLSLCEFEKEKSPGGIYINALDFNKATHLRNLRSLVCHVNFVLEPEELLPTVLSAFPQLTHLSVCTPITDIDGPPYCGPTEFSLRHQSLSSLELVEPYFSLPANVMKMMPSLRRLALFSIIHYESYEPSTISSWLRDLPALSSLVVVKGPPVFEYVESIPSSVTSLTLCPKRISSTEMTALSKQLPNLLRLLLEPTFSLGADVALVPLLFPGLRSLRLRHQGLPEEEEEGGFLSLAELKELELLETLDRTPPPGELLHKLRRLTHDRVRISHRQGLGPPQSCKSFKYSACFPDLCSTTAVSLEN